METEYAVEARHLSRSYHPKRRIFRRRTAPVPAVQDVSLALAPGTTLAISGPSGCGKSTLARCIACLEKFESGTLFISGQDVSALDASALRAVRRQIQLVPQASAASLNPRLTALQAVREPLDISAEIPGTDRDRLAMETILRTGLPASAVHRRTHQFSAGQRQRLALARALLCRPRVVILDESLTGLDLSVRASIVNLLIGIQKETGISYIVISHDTDLIDYMADAKLMMRAGRIVDQEIGFSGDAPCGLLPG